MCAPAAVEDCYDGPPGTLNNGICVGGTRICAVDGTWGACMGQTLPSAEDCQTSLDEDCDGATPACAAAWVLALGGESYVYDIETDSAGNVFAIGQFNGTVDFGGGNTLTSIGGYDLYVVKLSPSGEHIYSHKLGDPIDILEPGRLATDEDGNLFISFGFFGSPTIFGEPLVAEGFEGERDVGLAKLDPNGAPQWVASYGSTGFDYPYDLAVGADGNPVVAIGHSGPIYFGGSDVLTPQPSTHAMALLKLDSNGGYVYAFDAFATATNVAQLEVEPGTNELVLAGSFTGSVDLGMGALNSSTGALLLLRVGKDGQALSYRNYGGNGNTGLRVVGLIASVGGEVTISGKLANPATDLGTGPIPTQNFENFFVARFDAAGNAVYVKPTFPQGFGSIGLTALARTASDGALAIGVVYGTVDLGGGAFTDGSWSQELDSSGAFVNATQYLWPPSGYAFFGEVHVAPDGVPILGGYYNGSGVTFGDVTLPDGVTGFIARVAP